MSAIWGAISFVDDTLPSQLEGHMKEPYTHCVLDEIKTLQRQEVLFGCGTQYITKEDQIELMPISEEKVSLYFTSDVFLENREELLKMLASDCVDTSRMSDGRLLFEFYKKYGIKRMANVIGAYSFVLYDQKNKLITCVSDVQSSRCLYYTIQQGVFYFSTLVKPILNVLIETPKYNERWISDFLSIDSLSMLTEPRETPYEGIYKLEPGQIIRYDGKSLQKESYWDPTKEKFIGTLHNDEECKKRFLDTFERTIERMLRCNKDTGIFLSGGLDSTSIACFAAPILKKQGKALQAYTSIPENGYVSHHSNYRVVNESDSVKATAEFTGNIVNHFCQMENQNPWDTSDKMLDILELPYKAIQNVNWMYECLKMAYQDGCRVMFSGQFGNITISYGDYEVYFRDLLTSLKWSTFYKETKRFSSYYRYSRKRLLKDLLKSFKPHIYHEKAQIKNYEHIYTNRKLIKKYNIPRRFFELGLNGSDERIASMNQIHQFMYHKIALSHVGEYETKLSLATGVLIRDPTRAKEIISLCIHLPASCFASATTDRRIIREYLKEYLPTLILQKTRNTKGLQSADVVYRLNKDWKRIFNELTMAFHQDEVIQYFDMEKVEDALSYYKDNVKETDDFDIRKLIFNGILCKFITRLP